MGIYINKGNKMFQRCRRSEYVDKSGLIAVVNRTLFTRQKFSCVTRSRRFGKSMAAEMLCAYYDSSCQSRQLFADLQIASEPSFEEHLNKYPVIYLDMTDFITRFRGRQDIVDMIQAELMADVHEAYPDVPVKDGDDLMSLLLRICAKTGEAFVFIIDEWDAILREFSGLPDTKDSYVSWLRRMFKSVTAADVFAGVYMTGILPIKKYETQSALNNFLEYSMVEPRRMAPFFGFTKEEVRALAAKYGMDFDELEKWYDGYQIGDETSMFNPNSVIQAVDTGRCRSFWAATGSFDAITGYIRMNFDGLKDAIICMLGGGRVKVDPTGFQNDLSIVRSKDDVLTLLIHLGYVSYNWRRNECYLPNMEVGGELANAVRESRWEHVMEALQQSERLLGATLRGDAGTVAAMMDNAHSENTSILSYNDENSLACVVSLAYYSARNDYHIHREYPTGSGYADLVLIPRKNVASPALVVELKKDKTVEAAIAQIKRRNYPQQVADYTGDILLVGINYDAQSKAHSCQIEKWTK